MKTIFTFLSILLALVSGGSDSMRLRDVEVRTKLKEFQVIVIVISSKTKL